MYEEEKSGGMYEPSPEESEAARQAAMEALEEGDASVPGMSEFAGWQDTEQTPEEEA